jgi:hypothetical protein
MTSSVTAVLPKSLGAAGRTLGSILRVILGSPATRNRSCDKSQKIATLGNNLNAGDGQQGGEDAEMVHDGVPQEKKKKKDKG